MSKSMIKRTVTAGPLVQVAVYPAPLPRDGPRVREGKHALSSRAQQLMNQKYAWQKLKLLMAANFSPKDIYATLTYSDVNLPPNRERVLRDVESFTKALRAKRKQRALELKYIDSVEHKHGEGRWHIHILINSTGEDYELIRQLWRRGGVEFRKIRVDREKNFETLAKYFCKEPRDKPGQCRWSSSRNLKKPVKTLEYVSNCEVLRPPPKGRTAYQWLERKESAYGCFYYMEYVLLKGLARSEHVKRRRKNRKHFY